MEPKGVDLENLRTAVQSLLSRDVTRVGDSGKRHFSLENGVDGIVSLSGYCVSVSDPVSGVVFCKIHPISFIQMLIEALNGQE